MPPGFGDRVDRLAERARLALVGDILPFWLRLEDRAHGGHYAAMDSHGRIDPTAAKSTVFVARILWTLSEAHRAFDLPGCRAQAVRTRRFLLDRLADPADGAFWWSATHDGRPDETDKHVYAQSFAIYGLAADARATGDGEALAAAQRLFGLLEGRARDDRIGGYRESFDAGWRPMENRRMAAGGRVGTYSANTHLHLIEAYSGLLAAWPDPALRRALHDLLALFLARFLAGDGTCAHALLDAASRPLPGPVSYGHDIEASWLMIAAGRAVGDSALATRIEAAATRLARAATAAGQAADGSWIAGRDADGTPDAWRIWWIQAEAVVGLVDLAGRTGDATMLSRAERTWEFIERAMMDRANGDWFWQVDGMARPDASRPKVSNWKEPYHQARACLELMVRARLMRQEANGSPAAK